MSFVGIFSQQRPSITLANVDTSPLFFDATIEEASELTSDITEFPVETGAVGNDHAVVRPMTITMRVGISDNVFRAAAANFGDVGGPVGRAVAGTALGAGVSQLGANVAALAGLGATGLSAAFQAGQATTRSQSAVDAVRQIQRANAFVDVVGAKRRYENCLISSTRQEVDKENEGGAILVIEFTQVLVIDDSPVAPLNPPEGDPLAFQAQSVQDVGLLVPR